jgi:LacI family gluconate utilization system Gnt-I transcriptional repressor
LVQTARKRVTLVDVADAAGVSAITVSRVVNQPDKVSEPLRRKVQETIDMLGYIPNQSASALASAKSKVIGVVIPSLSNTVFNDVLRGIYDEAGSAGYKVLLVDSHYSPLEEEKMVRTLLGQSPAAMIITGGEQTRACAKMLTKADVPIVQIMELLPEPFDMNIGFSHQQAGYDVAKSLLASGYSHIGFIGARMDKRVQQRLAGYKQALEEVGKYWKNFVITTPEPSSVALGGELFRSLISSTNAVVDAVFCCNDDLALGALFESQRMLINVPEDMAICGFNDIEMSAFVNPPLSSVHVPRYEMGVRAAKMVIDTLNGKPPEKKVVDTGYDIRFRESTMQ